jgi:drug/metabolite transporter (DMT)-like permease
MNLSNALSDAVLASVSVYVFTTAFQQIPLTNRLLWGFFFATTGLAALAGTVRFLGYSAIEPLHQSLMLLAGSLGLACAVVAAWALLMNRTVARPLLLATVAGGLLFFFTSFLIPTVAALAQLVQALAILSVMLLAVYALRQRHPAALWVVVAVLLLGIATKASAFRDRIDPTDFYHYITAAALLSFGRAARGK